jgi:hypothetical protein
VRAGISPRARIRAIGVATDGRAVQALDAVAPPIGRRLLWLLLMPVAATAVYAVAIPACGALTASGQEKVSLGIQTAIALTCFAADTAAQSIHHENVVANGNVIQGLATQYQDLETAATAYLTGVNNACCPHAAQTPTP